MKIVIDPGHGGKDSGAVGQTFDVDYLEKDFNLKYALLVEEKLRGLGYTDVALTRRTDFFVYPRQRLLIAQKLGAEMLVSIHCNAAESAAAHGMEVIYRDRNDLPLAQSIHDRLARYVYIDSRGVKNDEVDLRRQLAVLSDLELPACLVEVGFITNESDRKEMMNYEKVAEAISAGMAWYIEKAGGGKQAS